MAYKQSKHLFQGMSKDLSDDKQKGIYYIDAHNIRITAREDTTLLSVTNEKGNIALKVTPEDGNPFILGQYVGHAVLNNYLVLFTVRNDVSNIWRLDLTKPDEVKSKLLYSGNLGFSADNPIETLVDYETEDAQKVYWTDGDNQPRVINIVSDNIKPNVDTQFDFIPEVFPGGVDNLSVRINKLLTAGGLFVSGTIQYFISYYNKFGQESNIVWQSPLLYISPEDRGGNVSESIANAFQLIINTPSTTFDYIRVYSIQHTSEDTDLIGKRVVDLQVPTDGTTSITFVDNGTLGESINVAELYYKGGVPTSVGTLTAKDQTLFLGNLKLMDNSRVSDDIRAALRECQVTFELASAFPAENVDESYYDYYNQLNENGYASTMIGPGGAIGNTIELTHSIKTYKYLETYRFGLQFQDKYGRWSEPAWIGDFMNNVAPRMYYSHQVHLNITQLPVARVLLSDSIRILLAATYVRVRPVVVLPEESERDCIAQGVLCPTVFSLGDRITNSPYAQPSWFFRPYVENEEETTTAYISKGVSLPFRHNAVVRGRTSIQGEIQIAPQSQQAFKVAELPTPTLSSIYEDEGAIGAIGNAAQTSKDFFYIDNSVVTLNSPDIENDTVINSNCGLRIIGVVPLTSGYGHYYLEATPPNNQYYTSASYKNNPAPGYVRYDLAIQGGYNYGHGNILCNPPSWVDAPWYITFGGEIYPTNNLVRFPLYPWQTEGALNDSQYADTISGPNTQGAKTAELKYKVLSNIRYSLNTEYFDNYICDYGDAVNVKLVNDTEDTTYLDDSLYYSNIDKLLGLPNNITTTIANHTPSKSVVAETHYGTYAYVLDDFTDSYKYKRIEQVVPILSDPEISGTDKLKYKQTATSIQYKSTPHAIIKFNNQTIDTADDCQVILPSINSIGELGGSVANGWSDALNFYKYSAKPINTTSDSVTYSLMKHDDYTAHGTTYIGEAHYPWNKNIKYIKQRRITQTIATSQPFLLLGEIYRTTVSIDGKFGGTTEDALRQNTWLPAGECVSLNGTGNLLVTWNEGDTYYQRWDCLKTYPYSNESVNNVVEIVSFMCETRTNIAGRYDKNRGLTDNTFITNENFNLINKGYTQRNNFFSYKITDERFNLEHFRTQLTWTKVKSAGALIDNWTNITLANTLDLDGDKGELVSLNRYKNDIIAFQPKGISQIIYNPNVQINTEAGLPIEIANSGKVQGKRYLYEGIGCQNKWSICDEVYGSLYFIDNLAKGIYKLSDQGLVSLTDTKGFRAWMESANTLDLWKPYLNNTSTRRKTGNFRTFYDKTYKDIYFVNGETCLVYSDLLDQFVSFMDYQGTNGMVNIGDSFYAISPLFDGSIWKQFAGEYNNIYNKYKNYSITFIDNAIPEMNKIYTNLEYRSDTYIDEQLKSDQTFDTIRVYNEYQDTGEHLINTVLDKPYLSDLQKKFRVWRIQLPRDRVNPLNRINNTWTKITLGKTKVKNEKTVLHDAIVGYYI